MGIEIDIVNGDAGWPRVKPLMDLVWTPDVLARMGNAHWADPDLRVIVDSERGEAVCHIGLTLRDGTWNDRPARLGGIGGVATHPDQRRHGYASIALNAAIQTFRQHEATDFVVLVCEAHNIAFYEHRGWRRFAGRILAQQHGERVEFDLMTPMVFDLTMRPRDGTIDLCGPPW